ncbi:hypothetical protein FJ208_02050, partial [Candidatus Gribaldobacteria bacterium]|nr:hypothetical protein [Candidatus Gribaldobacteria bacterium]
VDANIIVSALLGGKPSSILFDKRFQFITTNFTLKEVEKYFDFICLKNNLSDKEIKELLRELPITTYQNNSYKKFLKKAKILIEEIDKKDIDILALSLARDCYLWSQDKHFDKCDYQKIVKTYDFL